MSWATPDDADPTSYFEPLAGGYARHRPAYPEAAIAAVLDGIAPPVRAVDVGCGTGIATRLLAARGARVVGIDPSHAMLEAARAEAAPEAGRVEYRLGRAEATGLPAATFDLATACQAFHWFDAPAALRELRRLLVRGGRLALVWNVRERTDPFSRAFDDVAERARAAAEAAGRTTGGGHRSADPTKDGHFGRVRQVVVPNPHALTLDELLGRARSASYFPREGPLAAELEAALRAAFAAHARDDRVVLAQRTEVTLADAL